MMYRFIVIIAAIVMGNHAVAQDNQFNCKNPQYQQEMNYCAHQSYLDADDKLNAIYPKAIAAAQRMDSYVDADQVGAEQALREAQRAWITYRDKACLAEGYAFYGGTMSPFIVSTCLRRITLERVDGLRMLSEMG